MERTEDEAAELGQVRDDEDKPGAVARPGAKNQTERTRIRIRPGRRWSEIISEVKAGAYTWKQFTEGLSNEELARAQLRDSNGGFQGRPPTMVPREFYLACFRELKARFDEEFQKGVLDIARAYVELAQNEDLPVAQRAKMMQYAMERVFGAIPKEVTIKQEEPWESFVVGVVATEGQAPADWRQKRYDVFDPDMEEGSQE